MENSRIYHEMCTNSPVNAHCLSLASFQLCVKSNVKLLIEIDRRQRIVAAAKVSIIRSREILLPKIAHHPDVKCLQ